MRRVSFRRCADVVVGVIVPSRADLRHLGLCVAVGIGFGIGANMVESVLSRILEPSWPSWGGFACSATGTGLAIVTLLVWSYVQDWARR